MRKNGRTVYITEEIRKIPVIYLLDLEMSALDRLEKWYETRSNAQVWRWNGYRALKI